MSTRDSQEEPAAKRQRAGLERALAAAAALFALALVGFFVFVAIGRLANPVELEWMGGGMLDHVERVRGGKPLYGPPALEFTPFLYPPLYYWLAAALSSAMSTVHAARVVSVVATAASAILVYGLARARGTSRVAAWIGVGLFAGAYTLTVQWYDLERCDAVLGALLLGATTCAVRGRSSFALAAAGLLFAAAQLAKQPAMFVTAGAVAGAFAARDRRRALFVGGAALVASIACHVWLQRSTHGWYGYYVHTLPSSHGLKLGLLVRTLFADFPAAFALTAATAIAIGRAIVALRRGAAESKDLVLAGALGGALLAGIFGRMHTGGWPNVLLPWAALASVACACVVSDIERRGAIPAIAAYGFALLQMLRFAYDPTEAIPSRSDTAAAHSFSRRVRALEEQGEVYAFGRGHVTRTMHAHACALQDVLRAGGRLPDDFVEAFSSRKFAAFVIDDIDELVLEGLLGRRSELVELVMSNYFVAEHIDAPPPLVGWQARPTWIMRPRAAPLSGLSSKQLERRMRIEMAIAEMRSHAAQSRGEPVDEGIDVEELARRTDEGR